MKDDQVSQTALTVLQGILITAKKDPYQHLVSDDEIRLCQHILQSSPQGQKKLVQAESPLQRKLLTMAEKLILPGIALHYVLRKRTIEQYVRTAIDKGYDQIINLGAGFDSLCWRLCQQFTDINFIEIDHPASSALKQKALNELQFEQNNLHFLKVDFTKQTILDALTGYADFYKSRKMLFISEGIMMYLHEKDLALLMKAIIALGGEQTRFIFTAVAPMNSHNSNAGWLLKIALHFMSEPLQWLIEGDDINTWLQQHQFELTSQATAEDFRQQLLNDPQHTILLHKGEYISVAQPAVS